MEEELEKQVSNKPERNELGQLLPGHTANPNGRPKGKTMKEFAREYLMLKTDAEKLQWLKDLNDEKEIWRMAEGNPDSKNEISAQDGKPLLEKIIVEIIPKKDDHDQR